MTLPKRLDAMFAKENNGSTFWNKCGVAFLNKNGNGYNVILDSMPAPQDGAFKFNLFEPKEKNQDNSNNSGGYSGNSSGNSGGYSGGNSRPGANRGQDIPEDDIPF